MKMSLFLSLLPSYFQHDPLGLFLAISLSSLIIACVLLWIASRILP